MFPPGKPANANANNEAFVCFFFFPLPFSHSFFYYKLMCVCVCVRGHLNVLFYRCVELQDYRVDVGEAFCLCVTLWVVGMRAFVCVCVCTCEEENLFRNEYYLMVRI